MRGARVGGSGPGRRPAPPGFAPARRDAVKGPGGDDPTRAGIYAVWTDGPVRLANAAVLIDRDIRFEAGHEARRRFEGRIVVNGVTSPFAIPAEEFGNGHRLAAAIFSAGGPKVQVHCRYEDVARAIAATSDPAARIVTPDFGWTGTGDAYHAPSVRVDAAGVHPAGPDDPVRVDLGAEQCARHLGLAVPGRGELAALKEHVVADFLGLHDRHVMFTLLAAAALGVLYRFVDSMNRPAVWLVGRTGGGKSFAAKLAQNFFGDFPPALGSAVGSWSSTANFLQEQGYHFKDAMYLIDDYKPEVARHHEVVRLLQNYADGSARGRLNADATTNGSREIRGILTCTGEAIAEQTPSSLARSVVVAVPAREKDIARGMRCLAHRRRYPALMADFSRHLISEGWGEAFAGRIAALQVSYYEPIAGAQNDLRISGNLALLGAAFEEFAGYLAGAGPDLERQARHQVGHDLPAIRDEMVAAVRDQQASEVFLATLGALIEHGRVRIEGWPSPGPGHPPEIGKVVHAAEGRPMASDINASLALEAVQESLRKQSRPPLAATERALLDQLAADGWLLDPSGRPLRLKADGRKTRAVKLAGMTRKAFRIEADALIGPGAAPDG